jgi:quercetin dioxygenase-like cupin family protein
MYCGPAGLDPESGDLSGVGPPVPIPNTVVQRSRADDTGDLVSGTIGRCRSLRRGVEQWQLVGLITRRSPVRIRPPLPGSEAICLGAFSCCLAPFEQATPHSHFSSPFWRLALARRLPHILHLSGAPGSRFQMRTGEKMSGSHERESPLSPAPHLVGEPESAAGGSLPLGMPPRRSGRTPPTERLGGLARFCPHGFRRLIVARGPGSLVSLLAFEPGQCERIHQHHDSGEHFHGIYGAGRVLIDDTWWPIEPGATHFRPAGVWHGVEATTRLLLLSIQAPVPAAAQTVWRDLPPVDPLRPTDREALARHRCCGCPRCGGHIRYLRLGGACSRCGSARGSARCENCGWQARRQCLSLTAWRAS